MSAAAPIAPGRGGTISPRLGARRLYARVLTQTSAPSCKDGVMLSPVTRISFHIFPPPWAYFFLAASGWA